MQSWSLTVSLTTSGARKAEWSWTDEATEIGEGIQDREVL